MTVVRDCNTCMFRFIQGLGHGCAWCKAGITNAYRKDDRNDSAKT